eukprot:s1882_g3.t1
MGAPASGLVYAEGGWRPYMMVQGQMVIQAVEPTGASAVGLSLAAPMYRPTTTGNVNARAEVMMGESGNVPPPPPPPVLRPGSPSTPMQRTSAGCNATPGGTPVPPPPPPTPATASPGCSGSAIVAGEVEEPSKLVTKLPPLSASKGTDAAVVAGDWLAQLEPSMASLSSTAAMWWQQLMVKVRDLYQKWLESTPVDRLQIRQQVLAQRPPLDRYQRVEQRASMLLWDSLPEDLKAEAVSVRAVTVEAMVFLVHCSFQPGGSAEKAYLLHFLTSPDTGAAVDVDVAVTSIRKWIRLLRRGKELQVVLPDPSLLCRGLDKLHAQVFTPSKHPSAAFRIASFKLERQLDYKAKATDVEDYAQLILGELEAALLAQPMAPPPKLNRMEESGGQEAAKGKNKGKGKTQQPCWAWSDGSGCKYGQNCMFRHDPLGPGNLERRAVERRKMRFARLRREPLPRGELRCQPLRLLRRLRPLDNAREEFFEEAAKALKSLRLARATLDRIQVLGNGMERALVDSGATTSMRSATGRELFGLPKRKVLLAEGEAVFYQLPGGTLLTERETSPIVAMSDLMAIGCRVSWSSGDGCRIFHPVRGDLQARVENGCPEIDGSLGLELIKEAETTKLRRREAEIAVNKLVETCKSGPVMDWELGTKAVKDLRSGVGTAWAWLHRAFPQAPPWLVSALPVVASMDGAKIPWNRRERKRWKQASSVAVHLFCGRDRTTWKSRAEAAHVVTVDQAEDIMADDTYAALLDLAPGKIKMIFGGPPCRTFSALRNLAKEDGGPRPLRDREGEGRWGRRDLSEWEIWRVRQDTIMVFRMIFLWMVAAAVARSAGGKNPDFILEHPEDPNEYLKASQWALPEVQMMTSLWAFPELKFFKEVLSGHWWQFDQGPLGHPRRKPTRILATVPCPRELQGLRGPSVVPEEERDRDGSGFRSALWASWAPQLKEIIKSEVEVSLAGSAFERVMKMDAGFLEHLQRDHIPYRRDCRACLAGSFRGHIHRRVVAPDAWCLSLDVIGPARQGEDEVLKKVKYGLIGTLVVPDVLGKLFQPEEALEMDDGRGVGEILPESVWEDGDLADDEADEVSSAEKSRAEKEEAKWEAWVAKEKIDDVKVVEIPFFMPLSSKSATEALTATKEILLQVRRLGLAVKRVHTDCGREFVNKGFRQLCADRGFIRTTTGGDNYKSNGRVEALVGRVKNAVRTLLSASGMKAASWSFALRHYVARIQWEVITQLGGRYPRLPPFGTKVFVKKRSWKLLKEEFVEKVVSARILCPSMEVARGFLVRTEDDSYLTTQVAVENVKEVSGEFEVDAPPMPGAEPGSRHRIRGKTTMAISKCVEDELLCRLDPQAEEHLIQDEELAEVFLDRGDFSPEAVDELLDGLWLSEMSVPNRRGKAFQDYPVVSAHVAGMFRHGGVVGATNLARRRPALTKFLVQAMKAQMAPGTTFTTIALNFNNPMQCHRDSNNKPGENAFLMGFGDYVGGRCGATTRM